MGVSAVFALDLKGKVIIARDYRGDVALNCTDRFTQHLADVESEVRARPTRCCSCVNVP